MTTATTLQQVITDSTALLLHIQNVHWNTTGSLFYQLHNMTEEQYDELFGAIDDIAERLRAIGHKVMNNPADMASATTVQPANPNANQEDMLTALITAHQATRKSIQTCMDVADDEDDDVTEDLMIQRAAVHDKTIWLLESLR